MNTHEDLLFELGTEELPPLALEQLSLALQDGFMTGLEKAGLNHGQVETFATPRRLAVLIQACATRQPDRIQQRRGPALAAAFDQQGRPTKAAEGFARSCKTTVEALQTMKTDKGEWLVFEQHEAGQSALDLLPDIARQALSSLPIPKKMRWGVSEEQFVRPVHWLVFMLGDSIVPASLLGVTAGNASQGHRFHHPAAITLGHPSEYREMLRTTGKVIAHFGERRDSIQQQVINSAKAIGGEAQIDPALLDEVTALNEWPVAITGSFEEKYLTVPQEALILTMKKNQKYFHLINSDGKLMNHFITIANIDSPKPEVISSGNERVIRPRLADAMFFWEQDGKQRLEDHLEKLKQVVFQQKLGSMYEKSQRVSMLAGWIAQQLGTDSTLAERAGLLSRCDLLTAMVGEFADMQGIMGRYQALRDGEPEELAQALEEFYLPRFSGDQLPRSATGIALALAEKTDTLIGIFGIGLKPTGDKDPFALRRAALGLIRILREHQITLNLNRLLYQSYQALADKVDSNTVEAVQAFILHRFKGLHQEQGTDIRVFDAVASVKPRNIPDFDKRIQAVENFFSNNDAAESLASANKRISNLLRKSEIPMDLAVDESRFEKKQESVLYQAIQQAKNNIQPLLEQGAYDQALERLATIRPVVDDFFNNVMVMDDDPAIRNNRLALLGQLKALFMEVADISLVN